MVDFSKLPLGTRVVSPRGKGTLTEISVSSWGQYVRVTLENGGFEYLGIDGKRQSNDKYPSLFLDDGTFQWPEQSQPLPELEVDTLIWVREPGYKKWKPRYFSHWDQETERPLCFTYGATSKTAESSGTVLWKEYSLTDPNEPSVQDAPIACDSRESCSCRPNLEKGTTIWVRSWAGPWIKASFQRWLDGCPKSIAATADGSCVVCSWNEYRLTDPYA